MAVEAALAGRTEARVILDYNEYTADDAPKYLNTPETSIYHKGRVLYGLDVAREENLRDEGVFVVEGYTDVILLHQGGVKNVTATCGTALTRGRRRAQASRLLRTSRGSLGDTTTTMRSTGSPTSSSR